MKNTITKAFNHLPAPLLVILAIVSTNVGVALSKNLFATIGVLGTVSLQIVFGAIMLLVIAKPNLRKFDRKTILLVLVNGIAITVGEVFYFLTVAHLPLGIAVTIGFCGPLALALFGSKSLLDAVWLLLAGVGLFMIAPIHEFQQGASAIGYLYALLYALGLCLTIVSSKLLSNAAQKVNVTGLQTLASALTVSAIIVLPVGIHSSGAQLFNPSVLLEALVLALITVILAYGFQYNAISKLSTKSFGILSSSRPIVAAVIGVIILGDTINSQQMIAFVLIIAASVGSVVVQSNTITTKNILNRKQKLTLA